MRTCAFAGLALDFDLAPLVDGKVHVKLYMQVYQKQAQLMKTLLVPDPRLEETFAILRTEDAEADSYMWGSNTTPTPRMPSCSPIPRERCLPVARALAALPPWDNIAPYSHRLSVARICQRSALRPTVPLSASPYRAYKLRVPIGRLFATDSCFPG